MFRVKVAQIEQDFGLFFLPLEQQLLNFLPKLSGHTKCKSENVQTYIDADLGKWLWRSWQSGCFGCQRTRVRIQSSATFIDHLFTVNYLQKRRKIRKRGWKWLIFLKKTQWHRSLLTHPIKPGRCWSPEACSYQLARIGETFHSQLCLFINWSTYLHKDKRLDNFQNQKWWVHNIDQWVRLVLPSSCPIEW